ncbi:hypothetical protein BSR29_02620, partial [Boudabousia liubingyangii]
KPTSADGTALARVWESRTPPLKNNKRGPGTKQCLAPGPKIIQDIAYYFSLVLIRITDPQAREDSRIKG